MPSPPRRCAARTASRRRSGSRPTARSTRRSTKPTVRNALIPALKAGGYRAVAICLLNAYANPAHEKRLAALIAEALPGVLVTSSHQVAREFREFERASTTLLSAYVQPVIDGYLHRFESKLAESGFTGRFTVMQSNGGRLPASAMRQSAITALYSGPAAGVVGATRQAARSGFRDLITFDMGGTSTDVCLVQDGRPSLASESEIDGLPIRTPVLDIVSVGAGGGSIAWVDDGGMLRVGPQSAGADPGPACYGKGGSEPATTDAHIVIGTIRPGAFLGGAHEPRRRGRAARLRAAGGSASTLSIEQAAASALQLADANIVRAIQLVSTERGRDPRDYALVPFGGAGPLHAARIAEELGISTIVVPPNAGVISAYGLVASDYTKFDAVTRKMKLDEAAAKEAGSIFGEMRARLAAQFADMKLPGDLLYTHTLDMRFVGQAFEVGVEIPADRLGSLDAAYLAGAVRRRPSPHLHARRHARPAGRDRDLAGRRHPADRHGAAARPRDPGRARAREDEDLPRRSLDRLRPLCRRSAERGPEDRRPCRHRRLYRHDLGAARLDSRARSGGQSHPAEIVMTVLSPIDYAVISQALIASAREMGVKLIRSAYSTILREARDGSAGLMDRHGNTVAQAELIPMQLGPIGETLRACLKRHPVETLKEDDFLINNDPFEGGQHIPDVFIFTPIFVGGRVVGFGASVAHHLDLGGGAPGLNIHASDVYQEGIRFPPSRYSFKHDWNGGSFERLVTANVRVPDLTIGDFNAQFAANAIGVLRVKQLCERYGADKVEAAMAEMQDYSERRVRAAIAQAPKGTFYGEDAVDDDGLTDDPLVVKAKVTIADDSVEIDFEGTCAQVKRNLNCPYSSTLSAALSCVKSVLTSPDIPYNEGMARPITIKVPYGSLLNPRPPAPVRARMIPAYRVFNAVMKAMAQALPDKVIATGFDCTTAFCLSQLGEKGYSVYLEIFGGGYGASKGADGCDAVDSPLSNCSNAPVESLDIDYDFFRIVGYELAPDSFGLGARRGGAGFTRRCEILKDDVQLAIYSDRFRLAPEGLLGGEPGQRGYCRIHRADGTVEELKSKAAVDLAKGDIVEMFVGGGGGFGRVLERPDAMIDRDLADGLLTRDPRAARKLAAE